MSGIKICGLFRECDIDYVNEAGPDYAGFIIDCPESRRNVSPERAAQLRKRLLPQIRAVGVFVDRPAEEVAEAAGRIGLDAVQLHGEESEGYISALKERIGIPVWKAFAVRAQEDLREAERCCADEILLDSGRGTGTAFDWSILEGFPRPFILAGGLTPETIPAAARILAPEIMDLSSGVETGGVKDREKILAAVRAAHDGPACAAECG